MCPLQLRPVQSRAQASAVAVEAVALEDKFLARNFAQFADVKADPSLAGVRAASWAALPSMRMPTTRNEEYRFTDITPIVKSTLVPADASVAVSREEVSKWVPKDSAQSYVVIVNGVLRPELGDVSGVQGGIYVGPLSGAPKEVAAHVGKLSAERGGPFAMLSAAAARECVVLALPKAATLATPLYILTLTSGGPGASTSTSAPRLLVHAGAGSSASLVEEHAPLAALTGSAAQGGSYLTLAVAELFLEQDAQVSHGYVEREAAGSFHTKATLVDQAESSSYSLTEARVGGALSRHDVGVAQRGPRTSTDMRHFLLAGEGQTHDLHTKLVLEHPEGKAQQLHKCIAAASSARGVFDGNVQVRRLAQRTDAGQLSRNLLLAPRATVNVKPNLQIIADDVKCTHGCAVSDLSDEEMFYFRARGINAIAARQALVASFGAEVTNRLPAAEVKARVSADISAALANVNFAALTAEADS